MALVTREEDKREVIRTCPDRKHNEKLAAQ